MFTLTSTAKELAKVKNLNALQRYIANIDWDHVLAFFLNKTIILVATIFLFGLIRQLGIHFIKKGFKAYEERSSLESTRVLTLQRLTINIFQYTVFFFVCYSILSTLGVPVGSLIAGAGIAGVAIGLGAQGFINDFLTGFFIIWERQLEVGDYVTINNIEGTVVAVGLRTTQIKSLDGTLNFIPNRTITVISNSSREDMRVLIDIQVDSDIDVDKAITILDTVNRKHVADYPSITEPPEILGLMTLPTGQYVLRVVMYTINGAQFEVQRAFLAFYLKALREGGISVVKHPSITPATPAKK